MKKVFFSIVDSKRQRNFILSIVYTMCLLCFIISPAAASLVDNGNYLIYDTDLNITWYDHYFTGDWSSVGTQAYNFSLTDAYGNTYEDWKLPTTPGTLGGHVNEGEMGHLYYDELKNSGGFLSNVGPFTQLREGYANAGYCWTGTRSSSYGAWLFSFGSGNQAAYSDYHDFGALFFHDGNVGAPVPVPAAIWLLGSGLLGLLGIRRKISK